MYFVFFFFFFCVCERFAIAVIYQNCRYVTQLFFLNLFLWVIQETTVFFFFFNSCVCLINGYFFFFFFALQIGFYIYMFQLFFSIILNNLTNIPKLKVYIYTPHIISTTTNVLSFKSTLTRHRQTTLSLSLSLSTRNNSLFLQAAKWKLV